MSDLPPKPKARPNKVSLRRYLQLFRSDILSAQPERLYRAWMAEFRTPFFRSYMINQPSLIKTVLQDRPDDFPKSGRVNEGLTPLLGQSVFVTNGEQWKRQRRIIDPAFEGGRIKETFPAMWGAAQAATARLAEHALNHGAGPVEIEEQASHAAADVIFRTLFSIPIEHRVASAVFSEFRAYQRTQPLLNLAAFLPLPKWMPRFRRRETKQAAASIRSLLRQLCDDRHAAIENGSAPDDLATKIMTTADPQTGEKFTPAEMVDQVAIFFLAGHETSASALGWALYLLARYPEAQDRIAEEVQSLDMENPTFSMLSKLPFTRSVFRETLRLYPPVPMMVRENTKEETFRERLIRRKSQIVLSPWHLHRQNRLWDNPDGFDPDRWQTENGKKCQREAYIPFSAGSRVCTGAGFAMAEGVLLIALMVRAFKFAPHGPAPEPVAHLTVRARNGIHLQVTPRGGQKR